MREVIRLLPSLWSEDGGDGMSRVEELEGAIEKANRANEGAGLPTDKWQTLLMTDIAKSLAVIADKMTEEVNNESN